MFWIVVVLAFVAGFFILGLLISIGFLLGAILAGFIGKALAGFKWGNLNERFWAANLLVALLLFVFLGGAVGLGWLAGATFAWIWG